MLYKRNEYFRYTFGEPCDATFRLIKNANATSEMEMSKKGTCKIIDISPNGLRIYTQFQISIDQLKQVEMQFVLDESPIQIIGEFVWTKRKNDAFEYGIKLMGNHEIENLITEELKARRHKEVEKKK